ncbi:MAG: zinc ribbon domain-containing protein, partial [Candidatus Obscuribacterales bacterium]|nr:zinc ribbon domain-containing protein [Candidatus Obscuribacterales bacterium]
TETIVRCPNCSGLNAHGLKFCLFCGESLEGTADVRLAVPRPCKVCSIVDSLSHKFCTNCGSSMTLMDRANQIVSAEVVNELPAIITADKRRPRKKKKSSVEGYAAAAIILSTVIAGIYSLCQYQLTSNTGFLIHATPVGAEVTVEDKRGCVLKTGFINRRGELQLLGFHPGIYNVSLSHVGYLSSAREVVLPPNKIVGLGIPETIALQHEASDESETAASSGAGSRLPVGVQLEQSSAKTIEATAPVGSEQSPAQELKATAAPALTAAQESSAAERAELAQKQAMQAANAAALMQKMMQQANQTSEQAAAANESSSTAEQSAAAGGEEGGMQQSASNNAVYPMPPAGRLGRFRRLQAQRLGMPRFEMHPDPSEAPAPPGGDQFSRFRRPVKY